MNDEVEVIIPNHNIPDTEWNNVIIDEVVILIFMQNLYQCYS